MSKYTKLYWKSGSSCGGDIRLGEIQDGKSLCGVQASGSEGPFVSVVGTTSPYVENEDDPASPCPEGFDQVFEDSDGTGNPIIVGKERMCYVKTPIAAPGIMINRDELCDSNEMSLSTPDGVNFGYIYDKRNFCAPKDTNNFIYEELDQMEPHKASDPVHGTPLYGAARVTKSTICKDFARSDMLYARGNKTKNDYVSGVLNEVGAWGKYGGVGGVALGALVGVGKTLFGKKKYERICRHVNSFPDSEFSSIKYCPGSPSDPSGLTKQPVLTTVRSSSAANPKLTCVYPKAIIDNKLLASIDKEIYTQNLTGYASKRKNEIWKNLADKWCNEPRTIEENQLKITSAHSTGEYGRPPASQADCIVHTGDYKGFCEKSNNISQFAQTYCTRENLGNEKYDELWATMCVDEPKHKSCACYNIMNNKCDSDDSNAGCVALNNDWKMLKEYDTRETSKPEYSDHKYCFTKACNGWYHPDNYRPLNWDASCQPDIKICNDKVTVRKGTHITFSQALTCMGVEDEAFARTPEETRAQQELILQLIATFEEKMNQEPPPPPPEDKTEQYSSSISASLCMCFCLILVSIMLAK
tara:strand:+ start:3239 stop:4990 length:1752 start_codon:yes stop_codon:yes gene_type:complete